MKRTLADSIDLVCLSHLRWNFVFQRPQHLMSRAARTRRVFFVEEPIFDAESPSMTVTVQDGVHVAVPHLPPGTAEASSRTLQRHLLRRLLSSYDVVAPVLWFYTPMALKLVEGISPSLVVYDCMDELSGFAGASPELRDRERDLLRLADVVFTGGHRLYEAKREMHPFVRPFPSSVDVAHFARARVISASPVDQHAIPQPRIGFCGVIDERIDYALIGGMAERRRDWQFVMIGPTAKVDPASLPKGPNIHYLGMKKYDDLPAYFSGWDAAILPFAHNDATRFISPTKTPEYLAAGRPVVSTSIRDVVRPYGDRGFVQIADDVPAFIEALERVMTPAGRPPQADVDAMLATMSWDRTWQGMDDTMHDAWQRRERLGVPGRGAAVPVVDAALVDRRSPAQPVA